MFFDDYETDYLDNIDKIENELEPRLHDLNVIVRSSKTLIARNENMIEELDFKILCNEYDDGSQLYIDLTNEREECLNNIDELNFRIEDVLQEIQDIEYEIDDLRPPISYYFG